jgi:hypothetical protein
MEENKQEVQEIVDSLARDVIKKLNTANFEQKTKIDYISNALEEMRNALKDAIVEETQSKEQDKLFAALSKCLGEMNKTDMERTGSGNRGNYATLTDLTVFAMPLLAKYELCFRMEPIEKNNQDYLRSVLGHSSGQWNSSTCKITVDYKTSGTDPLQAYGKALTYMKKYVFGAYFGLHTGSEK